MKEFQELKLLVLSAEPDVVKADGGNRAACTRTRKLMQKIKEKAQELRVNLLSKQNVADVAANVGKQVGGPGAPMDDGDNDGDL